MKQRDPMDVHDPARETTPIVVPYPPRPFQIQLRKNTDDEVEIHHNSGSPITVTLNPPEHPGRVDHRAKLQTIFPNLWTILQFPPPEHQWVEITPLREWERQWVCAECPAQLFEQPRPDGQG
jgi:hypothetical protein